jgi:ABC-2 type transport system ATP-binding protein
MASPVIEVRGLLKRYGEVEAVRGIDLTVAEGEVLAVLGPNGAGKTTMVEILEGFRRRDGGDVTVLGVDPGRAGPEHRARLGIVLQENGVEPYLTVGESLQMNAGWYPSPRPVGEVLERVGLAEQVGQRVKNLSGGQRRRLDLGLALVGDPELFFLDEPTTGFDPSARRQAWDVVRGLCDLGKSVVLTTHYMDEAQHLADRVVVIAAGRVVAEGAPDEIGGRATGATTIRFGLPAGTAIGDLPPLDGSARVATDHDEVVVETDATVTALHALTAWALERGVDLVGLSVNRPSLEDVYLELTGAPAEEAAS